MNENLIDSINKYLIGYKFRKVSHERVPSNPPCDTIWVRRTWNTNRAVALIHLPENEIYLGNFCQKAKWKLLKKLWFFPVFYPLGLQLVIYGHSVLEKSSNISSYVDKIDNQVVVLQGVFIIDTKANKYRSARTWGQHVTGKLQDAISEGIKELYAYYEDA